MFFPKVVHLRTLCLCQTDLRADSAESSRKYKAVCKIMNVIYMETSGAVDVKGSQRSSFAARGGNRCID